MAFRDRALVILATLTDTLSVFRAGPAQTHPCSQTPASPHSEEDWAAQPLARFRKFVARLHAIPAWLGNRTDTGDVLILAIFLVAFLTGYAALLIDFPIPVLGLLGIISLATLALAGSAAWHRFQPAYSTRHGIRVAPQPLPKAAGIGAGETGCREQDLPLPPGREHGLLEQYWIESPFASVRIVRKGNEGFVYTVDEPAITEEEQAALFETSSHLRKVIVYDDPENPPAERLDASTVSQVIREFHPRIANERLAVLSYYLRRDLSGYGPLEALMRDPALEDISCNGENLPVFVFHRTHGSLPTNILFHEGELDQFVLKLAQKANKQISLSSPMVDATLPGGSRVQITFSNIVSLRGSSFTIRKFRTDPMTPLDLIRYGTYTAEVLAFLWLVIEHRKSLIIAGGTASGKTSTMNAVSLFIPLNAKIVSLEDTHEIQLPHKNWLATITRELTVSGVQGDIDLFSLLKASMRQRPEFIIVGEVRGREAQTLFQAMNTGHATLSTLHAGSVREAINRLTHEPISVPPVMFTALDLVISQSVFTYGNQRVRRCSAINEITVNDEGTIIPRLLYSWDVQSDTTRRISNESNVLDEIAVLRGWSKVQVAEELKKREEFLRLALDVPPPDILDLANAIHSTGE